MVNKAFLSKEGRVNPKNPHGDDTNTLAADVMMKYLDDGLKGKNYFLNTENPTRVDFLLLWYIDLGLMADSFNLNAYSNVKSWYDRCKARDGWKRSLEKGNGYQLDFKT